jgi:hypothetical protein
MTITHHNVSTNHVRVHAARDHEHGCYNSFILCRGSIPISGFILELNNPWNGSTGRGPAVHLGPRWTGVARTEGAAAPHRCTARGHWSSPVLTGDGGEGRAG